MRSIGFYLVAGALVGAPVLLAGFTADAHARHHPRVHSPHFAPPNISAPASNQNALSGAQKSEEHAAPNLATPPDRANDGKQPNRHSVGTGQGGNEGTAGGAITGAGSKETNSPDMKELGPVDTRITTVKPRLQGAKTETTRQGSSKIGSKTGKYFRAPHVFIRHKNSPVVRNTIGVPIAPHDVTAGQHGAPANMQTSVKAGAGGVVRRAPGVGLGGVFHPNAATGLGGPLANHGAISGTGFPHRGFVPAALGGQTRMTGGLNGSTVRPKY